VNTEIAGHVLLKPKRAQPFYGRHPWVFVGAIDTVQGTPPDGAVVDLRSSTGNFVARGLFNSQSKIRVRLYSWDEQQPLDDAFFQAKLDRALALRRDLLQFTDSPETAYRAVFSEADGLSGLVIDRYGSWLTVQFTALALAQRQQMFARLLMQWPGVRGIYLRTEKGIGQLEGAELRDGLLAGEPPPADLSIVEHGLRFQVNLTEGQKTGYYLDQRENRQVVAHYAVGRRVLDAFCYTGGFGLACARAGAASVECVDASVPALQIAQASAERNGLGNLVFTHADVFHYLNDLVAARKQFDLIILDPPKFARNRAAVPKALQGYRKLHQQALKLLTPNGVLVSCCCTGLISATEFEELVAQVATSSGRDVQLLERRGPAADHPVALACRETGYLKCLISRVS
jgi:23S rRNA (cytosine1962-C5)-methyltransferase